MKKGSRAAGIGKGSGPKPRQKISDIEDFQKKIILDLAISGSWSSKKKKKWDKCLQKPLIHDAKLILEILLIGSWSFKLPGFDCFCRILGQNPDSILGPLSSKPPGLQRICMILGQNPDSVLGPLSSKPPGLQQICMILGQNPDSVFGSWSSKHLQTTLFTVYLHDLGTKSRFSLGILILQASWFTAYLHDLGTKSRFSFWIPILQKKGWHKCLQKPLIHDAKLILEILLFGPWSSKLPSFECFCMILELSPDSALLSLSSKLPGLQRICMILGLNPGSILGSWSFKKTGWNKCLQKLLIHDAKLILEILLFGSWSSKLPGLQQICMILGQNPGSVLGSLSSKHLQTTLFTVYLHDLGTRSRFSFRILILQTSCFTAYLHDLGTKSRFSFRILILQTTRFTAYLHDLGTKSRFNFGILVLQKKGWDKCLQKPLIHDAKIILEFLLFGPWSSKLPSFECFCMILELSPDSALLSLSSKLPGLQRICMILGLNPGSILGSWSFKKTGWNKCLQKLLIHDAKLILEILLFGSWSSKLPGLQQICMILGQNPGSVLGSLSSKHLQTTLFTVYLHDLGTKSRFSFRILILQTSCFTAYLHDLGTKSRFNFGILVLQKKGWDKCLQKPLIHDAKIILEFLLFGPWSSKLPSFECFCMILELSPDSALLSLSSKLPGLQCICMILGLNLDSVFESWSSKLLGLQRICMILGLNPGSILGSWSFKKTGWNKCLQKLLIHDAKLILEILLFGSWSSKLPGLQQICMILGQNPDSVWGSLSSKHLPLMLL